MPKSAYFPVSDNDKAVWLVIFNEQFALIAILLGFTADDITLVNSYNAIFDWALTLVKTITPVKEECVSYKNLIRSGHIGEPAGLPPIMPTFSDVPEGVVAGIFPLISKLVEEIKAKPNYTEAIGISLGIIGSEQTNDEATMQPVLKIALTLTGVEVKWKKGHAQAIRIEVDRGAGFVFLAIDTVPDYTDTFAITAPATWKYRGAYLINDELVGVMSDVASINVG